MKDEPTAVLTEQLPTSYEALRLDYQLCFKLYAASKEVVRLYKTLLDELDLTYTQYIAMLALWEAEELSVGELGERLKLDSGTLSPLLKKLETKQWVRRTRNPSDERKMLVSLTKQGQALKKRAAHVPHAVGTCIPLNPQDAIVLAKLLDTLLEGLT